MLSALRFHIKRDPESPDDIDVLVMVGSFLAGFAIVIVMF